MQVKIQRWGRSTAICLPPAALQKMNLAIGDNLTLQISADSMILARSKSRPRYRLTDLMSECDLTASQPIETSSWEQMPNTGREI